MRRKQIPTSCDLCDSPATHFRASADGAKTKACSDHAAQAGFTPELKRYWPFPVTPESAWTDRDRDYVSFMRAAYAEGFRPREAPCSSIEAESQSGRKIQLVFRGSRNGWEPFLEEGGHTVRLGPVYSLRLGEHACACIRPPLAAASYLALEWLRGRELTSLLSEFTFVGGRPCGIKLSIKVSSAQKASIRFNATLSLPGPVANAVKSTTHNGPLTTDH